MKQYYLAVCTFKKVFVPFPTMHCVSIIGSVTSVHVGYWFCSCTATMRVGYWPRNSIHWETVQSWKAESRTDYRLHGYDGPILRSCWAVSRCRLSWWQPASAVTDVRSPVNRIASGLLVPVVVTSHGQECRYRYVIIYRLGDDVGDTLWTSGATLWPRAANWSVEIASEANHNYTLVLLPSRCFGLAKTRQWEFSSLSRPLVPNYFVTFWERTGNWFEFTGRSSRLFSCARSQSV